MLLYIVRHGDPIYETDTLTERGKLQAEAVGQRMFDAGIDRIFSSPMGRAKETADPACRLLRLEKSIFPPYYLPKFSENVKRYCWLPDQAKD